MLKTRRSTKILALVLVLMFAFSSTVMAANPDKIYATDADKNNLEFQFNELLDAYGEETADYIQLWEDSNKTALVFGDKVLSFADFLNKFADDIVTTPEEYSNLTDAEVVAAPENVRPVNADGTLGEEIVDPEEPVIPEGDLVVEAVSAINANALKVAFNKAVDTDAAKFAVKRGTVTEDVAVTWNEAKIEATLTKSGNFTPAEYTVTVSGVELAEGKDSGKVTIEAEKVVSLEIATEQLQKSTTAPIKINFINQYGEKATVAASSNVTITAYNTTDSTRIVTQPAVNKYELNALAANVGDKIQLTVIYKGLTATKTLEVVSAATVGAVNLVEPVLPEGKDKFTEAGTKNVEVKYTATNTLGEAYKLKATDKDSTVKFYTSDDQILNLADVSIDAEGKIKIAKFGTKAGEVTLTAIATATGNSSSIAINVQQNEGAPSTVEVEKTSINFAAGTSTKQYVALTVKDNYGKVIVAKDLKAADYVISTDNNTVATGALILAGENAGKIEITPAGAAVTKGQSATITVLVKATGQKATITATASEAAVPTAIEVKKNTTVPSSLLVGAVQDLELVVKDQYGLDITTGAGYTVDYTTSDATIVELSNKVTGLTNPKVTATAKKAGSATVKAQLKKDSVVQAEKAFAITVVPNDSTKVTYEVTDIPTLYQSAGTLASVTDKATALANGYFAEFSLVAKDASGNVSNVPASAVLGTPTTALVPTPGEVTPGTWAAADVKVFNDAGKWYIGANKATLAFPKDAASKDLDLKGKVRFTITNEGAAQVVEKEFTISKDALKATEIKLVKDTDATTNGKAAIDTTNPTKLFKDVVDANSVEVATLTALDTATNTDTYFVVVKDQFGVYAVAQTGGSLYNTATITPVNPKGYEDASSDDAVTLTSGALAFSGYAENYLTANTPSFQAVVTHATLSPVTINVKSAETATATADVALALTTPAADANNTITGGGADKTVVVKVAKNTASVVLTGTFAVGQAADKGGADQSDVTIDSSTATAPTFTVDTTSVKDGGSKTFTIIVKEAAKGNVTYNVTVTVSAS